MATKKAGVWEKFDRVMNDPNIPKKVKNTFMKQWGAKYPAIAEILNSKPQKPAQKMKSPATPSLPKVNVKKLNSSLTPNGRKRAGLPSYNPLTAEYPKVDAPGGIAPGTGYAGNTYAARMNEAVDNKEQAQLTNKFNQNTYESDLPTTTAADLSSYGQIPAASTLGTANTPTAAGDTFAEAMGNAGNDPRKQQLALDAFEKANGTEAGTVPPLGDQQTGMGWGKGIELGLGGIKTLGGLYNANEQRKAANKQFNWIKGTTEQQMRDQKAYLQAQIADRNAARKAAGIK